ncbi:phage tail tape measure protein [Aureimonas flava]|uniref:Phage tail tape measure protein n=1 Tax=Aureimonas flava TaxID=2320271 RepID=A0A3A1WSR3_9HYPH|nr:phage tail tape measure protein [Aureimonas flava]RIY01294.1 phage tail tape measure protein [Aureimonas flava]
MVETVDALRIAVEADTSGFDRALGDLSTRANAFGAALTSAFRGAVGGGRSLDSVLRQLGGRISTIALDAALRPLTQIAGGLLGQVLSGVGGGVVAGAGGGATPGGIVPFAKGGVVRAPSFFPHGGRIGLMGEAGAEAILPLRRGPDGSLGVAAPAGAGRAGPSIVFNVSTPDAPSFRRAEVQIQAMIARAAMRGQRGL